MFVVAYRMMYCGKGITGTAIILIATLITPILASFIILSNMASPAEATLTSPIRNDTTLSSSSEAELSPQPVYQENITQPNITSINQTHATFTFSGNGILSVPNMTQTINTISNGTGVILLATSSGYAWETIKTEDDNETLAATFYEIVDIHAATLGGGRGIVTALFQANSSGMFEPLNGTIAVGVENVMSGGESQIILWRWDSGSSNNNNSSSRSTENSNVTDTLPALHARVESSTPATALAPESPIANATVASDTNATIETDREDNFGVYPFFGLLEGENWFDRVAANHTSIWVDTDEDIDADDDNNDDDDDDDDDDEDDDHGKDC